MRKLDTGLKKPRASSLPVPGGKGKKPSPAVGTRASKVKSPRVR